MVTVVLAFMLTDVLTFMLRPVLTDVITFMLTFVLTFMLTDVLTFMLTFVLTFMLTFMLTFILRSVHSVVCVLQEREDSFQQATHCWICEKPLEEDRVRDHDHLTGLYRGAAHQACNLQLRICPQKQHIPVVFHNLKGYDSHLLISAIGKTEKDVITYTDAKGRERSKTVGDISVVPSNMEKFISFSWRQFRYVLCFHDLIKVNACISCFHAIEPQCLYMHVAPMFPHALIGCLCGRV